MPTTTPSALRLVAAAALALAAAGCGETSDEIDRRAVGGSVTLDGKPLESGSITFSPTGLGPSAGGEVAGGRFAIRRAEGPSPGRYEVRIVSVRPTGRKVPDQDGPPGSTVEEMADVIPPRYNLRSELTAEVTKDGKNQFDFDLVSAPATRRGRR